ncbi:ASI1-immunoprecipitated protein 3-like protein, partial [Drosera capensis]
MHGWGGGEGSWKQCRLRQHMWSVSDCTTTTTSVVASASSDFFFKDVRKITVGDCALFKPPQDSPPFIGIIRSLASDKDRNLKLEVNWLYRPGEVKLGKDVAVEAAPNEVFYSFHRDEISAASLLHPCKVAFLPKGAILPAGVSSFVCRRVYDITNKRFWWLTDRDYTNVSTSFLVYFIP